MIKKLQNQKAKEFLDLHNSGKLLVLPNIWNPIGARMLQLKGFSAAATSSAAISSSLGFKDGEHIKFHTQLDILKRIVDSVDIPVTADIESGYAKGSSGLKNSVNHVIQTGVVGINIEDSFEKEGSLRHVDQQCERISGIREVAEDNLVSLVINARVDCFLSKQSKPNTEMLNETIERANRYHEAGADCVYPIGVLDKDTILTLRKEIIAPINILGSRRSISLKEMQKIGINRVTFGPFLFRSVMKKFANIVDELGDFGSNDCFSEDTYSYDEALKYLRDEKE
jgi:2-methylisocitrate lyase-like PEP mutase family enzyme